MASRLHIFFNSSNGPAGLCNFYYEWRDEQGRIEECRENLGRLNKPLNIKQVFLEKGMAEISEFDILVSNPAYLNHWLRTNDATQLSTLSIFSSALDTDDDALPNIFKSSNSSPVTSEWQLLFELLATNGVAPNLKRLKVYWDCEGRHRGLGKSVGFIRALGKLRPKEHVTVKGFYAVNWPAYLEREMCVPVIMEERIAGLGGFQSGTQDLFP